MALAPFIKISYLPTARAHELPKSVHGRAIYATVEVGSITQDVFQQTHRTSSSSAWRHIVLGIIHVLFTNL